MKTFMAAAALAVLTFGMTPSQAEDAVVAAALAKSAAKLNEEGKIDKAKSLCYKALANDENCPEAIFELGKIMEQEGNMVSAGDFYVQSIRFMSKDEATYKAKIAEAHTRLTKLNPFANQLNNVMGDYVQDLNTIVKKNNDSLTKDETYSLSQNMRFDRYVAPDKLPRFERGEATQPVKTADTATGGRTQRSSSTEDAPQNDIPLEVEKALKAPAAGWTKISGTWKKKGENLYEVTDGRLEAEKTNGAIQCTVVSGGKGSIEVFARNGRQRYSSYSSFSGEISMGSGYGYRFKGSNVSIYTPYNGFSNDFVPYKEKDFPITGAKTNVVLTIDGNKMEYLLNGGRVKSTSYPISADGNFVIAITGTMIIELPQAVGK